MNGANDFDEKDCGQTMAKQAAQRLDQLQREAAASPKNREHPPGFEAICCKYALCDTWTLEQAALLLCACDPQRGGYLQGQDVLNAQVAQMRQLLESCIGASLKPVGREPRFRKSQTRCKVSEICALCRNKGIALPSELSIALDDAHPTAQAPHANKVRYENARQAAINRASELVREKPRRFKNGKSEANISALAAHLASHPEEWAPDYEPGEPAPIKAETLKKRLREHFRR